MGKMILLPAGRMVWGSLYIPQTKKFDGTPLITQTGEPRIVFNTGVAIKKEGAHWNTTSWGAQIWEVGLENFREEVCKSKTFAWKIIDGDSQEYNQNPTNPTRPCDIEGYPGHWVLRCSNGFAPVIFDQNNVLFTVKDGINPGDYIQINLVVVPNNIKNKQQPKPGIHLNQIHVKLLGYGQRIVSKLNPASIDVNSIGFTNVLPVGASTVPLVHSSVSQVTATSSIGQVHPTQSVLPPPYPQILNVPLPPKQRKMLPAANGSTYEQLIANGWTDEMLIQYKMMEV